MNNVRWVERGGKTAGVIKRSKDTALIFRIYNKNLSKSEKSKEMPVRICKGLKELFGTN